MKIHFLVSIEDFDFDRLPAKWLTYEEIRSKRLLFRFSLN